MFSSTGEGIHINRYAIYLVLFGLSFLILSLQIVLAVLLEVFLVSPIIAISFAFLGLSTGGVFSYVKYFKKNNIVLLNYISIYINCVGVLLLLYTVAMKWYNIISLKKESLAPHISWYREFTGILYNSFLVGVGFVVLFFCLGIVISLIYKYYSNKAHKLYFFDLLGAACGCIFGTIILNFLQVSSVLILFSFWSFLLLILVTVKNRETKRARIIPFIFMVIAIVLLLVNLKTDFLEPKLNPNSLARDWKMEKKCEELWYRWNTYSRVSLVKTISKKNAHDAYIFSINSAQGLAKLLPFVPEDPYAIKLFGDFDPTAFAFLLNKQQDILILFAGSGADLIRAYSYSQGTSNITGVELNPLIVKEAISLPGFNLKTFFTKENVHMVVQEGRSYLETTNKLFDSIILSWSGASSAQYLGIPSFTGQYLYTKEAFMSYLKHLRPNGTIGIVNLNKIKVIAMAKEAFEQLGYDNFSNKIIIFDDSEKIKNGTSQKDLFKFWDDKGILIKKSGFSREEIDTIKKNILKMNRDWIYNPYYTHKDFKILEDLIKTKDTEYFLSELSKEHHLDFTLPTDNKPFATNMFLVSDHLKLNNMMRNFNAAFLRKQSRSTLFNFLYLSFNIFIFVIGLLLIVLPLVRKTRIISAMSNLKILVYFAVLGLGFIFVEIGVIHVFTLFLGNPIYSFSVALATFLLALGGGSLLSQYLFDGGHINIKKFSLFSSLILFSYFIFLPQINKHLLCLSFFLKFLITLVLIFPIGICLGVFFPFGIKKVYNIDKNLIPWAWGMNGYMSIVGSVLSPYLSWTIGFSGFLLLATFLYSILIFLNIREFN